MNLKIDLKKKGVWILIVAAGAMALAWDLSTKAGSETKAPALDPIMVDTVIPRGHTLVPVEVQNYESLDSVFGNYGIVSLYTTQDGGSQKPKLLAERVKMMRAPLNPAQFGVMVPDADASQIAGTIGPVFVVLHSRSSETGGVERPNKIQRSKYTILEEK